jgi:hypothetical protein
MANITEGSDHEADAEAEMSLSWKVNSCDKRQYMLHNFTRDKHNL